MMGDGWWSPYGYGRGSSSSAPSNLSASALPFTCHYSVSNPLATSDTVPFNPSVVSWVNPPDPESGSLSTSSIGHGYGYPSSAAPLNRHGSASTDPVLYGPPGCSGGFVEANPYYSSYVPPNVGDSGSLVVVPRQLGCDLLSSSRVAASDLHSFGACSHGWEGLDHWGDWEGLADCQQSKPVELLLGNLCAGENLTNQGCFPAKDTSKLESASQGINVVGWENCVESANTGNFDYESFPGRKSQFIPIDCSTSTASSSSVFPATFPYVPSLKRVNSRNLQITHGVSHGQSPRKHGTTPNDAMPAVKSSPVVIRPPEQDSLSVGNVSTDNGEDDKDITHIKGDKDVAHFKDDKDIAHSRTSIAKEDQSFQSCGGRTQYNASQIGFHLEENDEIRSNKSFPFHALDHLSAEKPGIQVPFASLDGFNLATDNREAINSVENYSTLNSIDHYNPAVDSPCWKGAPNYHLSSFNVSQGIRAENMKSTEASSDSNLLDPQTIPLTYRDTSKVSLVTPNENLVCHNVAILENCLGPLTMPLVSNTLFREETDVNVKTGAHTTKSSSCCVSQMPDDMNKGCGLFSNVMNSFDPEISHSKQGSPEEGKWTSENFSVSGNAMADVGKNVNDDCSSHVPFNATTEKFLNSPPSAENTLADVDNSHCGESIPKISVGILANTLHHLSELLLVSCLTDKGELKEEDTATLVNVINNLDMCLLKNVDRMTAIQESLIPNRATSQCSGKLSTTHESVSQNRPQAPEVDAVNGENPLKNQHVQVEKGHDVVSDKKDPTLSKFPVIGAADIIKDDNITQAIKNVLSQNFLNEEETDPQILLYKNLWLEAEASLCSFNCMARFNQMKIEMEKCNFQKENVLPSRNMAMEKPSRSVDTEGVSIPDISVPDSLVVNTRSHADDVLARLQILNSCICNLESENASYGNSLLSSKVSHSNMAKKLACEANDYTKADKSIHESPRPMTTTQVDDVTDRGRSMEATVDKCSSVSTSVVEKLSSPKFLLDLNNVNKVAYEAKHAAKPDISIPDFFIPTTSSLADDVTDRVNVICSDFVNASAEEKSSAMDSPALNNVDTLAYKLEDASDQYISIQDFFMGSTASLADDVTARFHILQSRIGNFPGTSAVEKFSSSEVPPALVNVDKLENEVKGGAKQDISIQESPMPRTSSQEDNVEASVMARYRILKCRGDIQSFMHMEHYKPDGIDLGYTGLRRDRRICEDDLGNNVFYANVEPVIQNHASNLDKSTVKDFNLSIKNGPMIESRMADGIGDQPQPSRYDSSSTDWEHVFIEGLSGQNS